MRAASPADAAGLVPPVAMEVAQRAIELRRAMAVEAGIAVAVQRYCEQENAAQSVNVFRSPPRRWKREPF